MKSLLKKIIFASTFLLLADTVFAMEALVVSTKGKVEVQNGNVWIPLSTGDKLSKGSVIQTGFKSELVLKIKETSVTVDPLSRLTIEQLAEKNGTGNLKGRDETKIFLDTGSLKSNVKKSEDRRVSFTVRSQVATAAVRGTILNVTQRYKSVEIKTVEGSVAVWKEKNAVPVISSEEEDLRPIETAPSTETTPEAISDDAPRGSFISSRGNVVTFENSGTVVSASENARKETIIKTTELSEVVTGANPEANAASTMTSAPKEYKLNVTIYRVE